MLSAETKLGEGFSNSVRECAGGRVIRKALTEEAREALIRQFQFMPWLGGRLPVAIPIPESLTDNAMIYRKLPGETLTPQLVLIHGAKRIAAQVGDFIAALHALPLTECIAAGVTQGNRTANLLLAFERTLAALSPKQGHDAETWRERFLATESLAVMIHGDLWFENILIDGASGRLTGVVDFDAASIGDATWDLATQLHLGTEFFKLVFEAYPNRSAELSERAYWAFQLRCFEGLDLAMRRGDQAEFRESIEKLRESRVLR